MRNPAAQIGTSDNPLVYTLPEDQGYMPSYDWLNPVLFDVFWLVFPTFGPFTAAAQLQQQVNVPNDADFEVRRIMYHFDLAAAALTQATSFVPNITIMLTDSGSGRNLLSAAAPIGSIASAEAAMTPIDLPWPKIFTRNSTITITLTNFDAAVATNTFRLVMAGRKIFSK